MSTFDLPRANGPTLLPKTSIINGIDEPIEMLDKPSKSIIIGLLIKGDGVDACDVDLEDYH